MDISYRSGVGELIWAMTTCRPDMAYVGVKLSQANACPHEHHFHGVKHALKYHKQDLLMEKRPEYDAHVLHAYADSDCASCVKTH